LYFVLGNGALLFLALINRPGELLIKNMKIWHIVLLSRENGFFIVKDIKKETPPTWQTRVSGKIKDKRVLGGDHELVSTGWPDSHRVGTIFTA
jgi:hypothetical protein